MAGRSIDRIEGDELRRIVRAGVKMMAFRGLCCLSYVESWTRSRRVIVYCKHADFTRKCEAYADLLRARGFAVEVRSGFSLLMRARLKVSRDLWIGFWNTVPIAYLPKRYIFVNAEPLNVPEWQGTDWHAAMRGAREVWGYTESNAAFVEELGVPFRHVPFGYAPYYEAVFERNTSGKALEQDIDVLFVGSISDRRERILEELQLLGLNVRVVNRDDPVVGEELDELLARSKITLGVHYYDEPRAQIADLARVDHLLSNRLFVVHERPAESAGDLDFERNVTTCEYGAIGETCMYFAANAAERLRMAEIGYQWFKSDCALDSFIPYEAVKRLLRQG